MPGLYGECPEHLLEEPVDSADIEERVVVQNSREQSRGMPAHRFFHGLRSAAGGSHVRKPARTGEVSDEWGFLPGGYPVQLLEDSLLHLAGSLVGECHRQNRFIAVGPAAEEHPQILPGKFVGLARPGRRLAYLQHILCHLSVTQCSEGTILTGCPVLAGSERLVRIQDTVQKGPQCLSELLIFGFKGRAPGLSPGIEVPGVVYL